jgi:hypothetical protein
MAKVNLTLNFSAPALNYICFQNEHHNNYNNFKNMIFEYIILADLELHKGFMGESVLVYPVRN